MRLNRIVQSVLGIYADPESTKKSKSDLIKSIMQKVRDNSPGGGFVKFDSEAGLWFEVGNRIAREKVSQTFRDALNDKYRSSTTSKTLKRRQERINRTSSISSKDDSSTSNRDGPQQTSKGDIPEAQARVDSLLMAAGVTNNRAMLPSNGMPALPHAHAFMNPYMMPGPGMMVVPSMAHHFNPSLTNYMAASMGHPSQYTSMMVNTNLAQQQAQAQMGQSPFREPAKSQKPQLEP